MKLRYFWMISLGTGLLQLAAVPTRTQAANTPTLPRLSSLPDDPFTDAERQGIVEWTLTRPELQARLEGHRHRLLKVTSDHPKGPDGEFRRATLVFRNYGLGLVHIVRVDLDRSVLEIEDADGVIPPNMDEIDEAMAIVRRDAAFADLVADPSLSLIGGFVNRSLHPDDPCFRELCLEFQFAKASFDPELVRGVIVNLTRQTVAHHDFQLTTDGAQPARMTESEGDHQ